MLTGLHFVGGLGGLAGTRLVLRSHTEHVVSVLLQVLCWQHHLGVLQGCGQLHRLPTRAAVRLHLHHELGLNISWSRLHCLGHLPGQVNCLIFTRFVAHNSGFHVHGCRRRTWGALIRALIEHSASRSKLPSHLVRYHILPLTMHITLTLPNFGWPPQVVSISPLTSLLGTVMS